MLSEGLTKLGSLVEAALKPIEVENSDEFSTTYFVPQTREFKRIEYPPPDIRDCVDTIDDFIAILKHHKADDKSNVFLGLSKSVAILNDDMEEGYRKQRLFLRLSPSTVFGAFADAQAPKNQKDFLRKIRTDLAVCDFDCDLKSAIETIKWRQSEDSETTHTNQTDGMGRSVRAEVQGMKSPIPETVKLSFYPFPLESSIGSVQIECELIVDHAEKKFFLIPHPHSLDLAKRDALISLQTFLAEATGVLTMIGEPS